MKEISVLPFCMKKLNAILLSMLTVMMYAVPSVKAFQEPLPLSDIDERDPYYEIIASLYQRGVIKGTAEGKLLGDQPLNRAELVVIVVRATGIEILSSDQGCFSDVQEEWFAGAVCAMVRKGWISGYPGGVFLPARTVTTGEAAKIILNALLRTQFTDLDEAVSYLRSKGLQMKELTSESEITRKEAFARLYLVENAKFQDPEHLDQMDSEGNLFNPVEDTMMVIEDGGPVFYTDYNSVQFERHKGTDPVILFFHAEWCPLCRQTEANLLPILEQLQGGAVIFKVDYDTETELKRAYGITYQDTIVVIDSSGNAVQKSSGPRSLSQWQTAIDQAKALQE